MPPAKPKSQLLGFAPLWTHRELLKQLLKRRLSQEHKNTLMGRTWLVLRPLTLLALYVFVFGYVFEGKFDADDESKAAYALGVFLGLSIIHFLSDIFATAPRCLIENQSMVTRVKLPLEVLPISITATATIHFLISMGLCLLGLLAFGLHPSPQILWLAPLFACLALLGLGLAYLFAVLGVWARDITQITPVMSMGLLFASAVFYPLEKIPAPAWTLLKFNPVLLAVEATRRCALWDRPLPFGPETLYFVAFCLLTYLIGYLSFQAAKPHFADQL